MMSGLPFLKMHGIGNDFVVVDTRESPAAFADAAVRRIGDRHRGIGFDQFITIEPPRTPGATVFMGIRNPDGSEAGACGNATRCVADLILRETGQSEVVIETISGLLPSHRAHNGLVTVDMGAPRLDWAQIPLAGPADTLDLDLTVGPLSHPVAVSMGNPHAVFFVPDAAAIPLTEVGPQVEHHPLFPARTNVEVVEVLSRTHLRLRVWERGAGITLACGSGACATLVAAVRRGLTERRATITLDGGDLTLDWRESDGHVLMTGPVATSFGGTLSDALLIGDAA